MGNANPIIISGILPGIGIFFLGGEGLPVVWLDSLKSHYTVVIDFDTKYIAYKSSPIQKPVFEKIKKKTNFIHELFH